MRTKLFIVPTIFLSTFLFIGQAHAQSVTVLSPNGGEQWVAGQEYEIKWSGRMESIYVFKTNQQVGAPAYSIVSHPGIADESGIFRWKIPTSDSYLTSGSYVLDIKGCCSTTRPDIPSDNSNAPFNIVAGTSTEQSSVKISYPTGGSIHRIGDYMMISYCGVNFSPSTPAGTTHIYLVKGGSSIALIANTQSGVTACSSGNSIYSWKVGEFPAGVPNQVPSGGLQLDSNYRILIDYRDQNGKNIFSQNYSEGYFSIIAATSQPVTPTTPSYIQPSTPSTSSQTIDSILQQIRLIQEQIARLQNQQSSLSPTAPVDSDVSEAEIEQFSHTFNRNLYFGIRNNSEVTALQNALLLQGIYKGPVTGNFFNLTLQAVREFQGKYGIEKTGYIGILTRKKLNELYSQ